MPDTISDRLKLVLTTIKITAKKSGRLNNNIQLLAVSKKQSIEKIKTAFNAGQKAFGENYLQEALEKQAKLKDLPIEWHFIGSIQSRKAKSIAHNFDWAQSIDRLAVAEALNKHRPKDMQPLNICIQVNIDSESTKSGLNPNEVIKLANEIKKLPRLKLRGLMAIPKKLIDPAEQYKTFLKVAQLQELLTQQDHEIDTLSMGMSADLIPAIEAGSTMIRVGTAIFGERKDD